MDFAEKMQRYHEYVDALEEERRKIQVFQRELPLCLELVTQAIEACKRELSGTTTEYMHGQSECSEQTSSEGPVLAEFIPIKRTHNNHNSSSAASDADDDHGNADDDDDDDDDDQQSHNKSSSIKDEQDRKKSDWLRSVQLWNQSPDLPPKKEEVPRKEVVKRNNGGAFQPFHREKSVDKSSPNNSSNNCNNQQAMAIGKAPSSVVPASADGSTADTVTGGGSDCVGGNGSKNEEKEGQNPRKQRRCWSPELHRRFLHALQQLGGSHVATPKQIRELMKVDGLTNDEVKSHLQKYRLHTRRPSPAIHSSNSNPQAPQFVVVGGIWVPPAEYAAAMAAAATESGETSAIAATNKIYAPVAAPPPPAPPAAVPQSSTSLLQKSQPTHSENALSEGGGGSSHSEGGGVRVRSNSPASSSSTHTTTTSPMF